MTWTHPTRPKPMRQRAVIGIDGPVSQGTMFIVIPMLHGYLSELR